MQHNRVRIAVLFNVHQPFVSLCVRMWPVSEVRTSKVRRVIRLGLIVVPALVS